MEVTGYQFPPCLRLSKGSTNKGNSITAMCCQWSIIQCKMEKSFFKKSTRIGGAGDKEDRHTLASFLEVLGGLDFYFYFYLFSYFQRT